MQFVDVKNDIAFRKIFGNENKKVILLSFLNAVLGLEGDARIAYIDIINPFQLPIVQNLKASVVDLRVRDGKGNPYVIEMQVAEKDGLDKRLLYYMSKEFYQQINSGEDYPLLKPVIFIGIFDFDFTPAAGKYLSHHAFCDVENGDRVLKDMDFFFVELPKFKKTLEDTLTIQDKWIFFIKEAENLELVPENLGDEGLAEAYHDAAKFNWTKEEIREYDYAAMREQDLRGEKAFAVRKAAEIAKAEGKAEGNDEAEGRIVLYQASQGKSVEEISANTGLSIERVKELLSKDK
jgi:predicted transposase/invertase (TIGR01784 family)